MNVELKLTLPDTVELNLEELKTIFIYALFDRGILSSGQAAKILEISRTAFLENAGKYSVSIFQYDEGELEKELAQWP
jgi:predicted HTH domain antitoxin